MPFLYFIVVGWRTISASRHLSDFSPDEFFIVTGTGQRGDALAPGQDMHRQRIGVFLTAKQGELFA